MSNYTTTKHDDTTTRYTLDNGVEFLGSDTPEAPGVLEVLFAKLAKYEASEAKRVAWCHRHRVNPDTGDLTGNWKNAIAACKEAIAEEQQAIADHIGDELGAMLGLGN